MDALVRVALPIGLFRSQLRPAEHTLVLKTTYVFQHGAYARLAPVQESLREAQREGGRLIYPTDFGEAKLACDVVFVGPVLLASGPTSLRVGTFERRAASPRVLGPAVQLDRQWASSCAPADGRIAHPSLPLPIEMNGPNFRMSSVLPAPAPAAALIVREQWEHLIPVALRIDTLLIDPSRSMVEVVSRGTFSYSGNVDREVLAVIDITGALASENPELLRNWSRLRVLEPAQRRPAPTERGEGTATLRRPAVTQKMTLDPAQQRAGAPQVAPSAPPPQPSPAPVRPAQDDEHITQKVRVQSAAQLAARQFEGVDASDDAETYGGGAVLGPQDTMTLEVTDEDLEEPPTPPPQQSPLARSDTMTLDAPVLPQWATVATPFNRPLTPPAAWGAGGPATPAKAPVATALTAAVPPATPFAAPTNPVGLPPLPSLASLVVSSPPSWGTDSDPNGTVEVRRPDLRGEDASGPKWLTERPTLNRAPLSTDGTPFRSAAGPSPSVLASPPPALGVEHTADYAALPAAVPTPAEAVQPAPFEPVASPSALKGIGMSLQRAPEVAALAPPPAAEPPRPMMGLARLAGSVEPAPPEMAAKLPSVSLDSPMPAPLQPSLPTPTNTVVEAASYAEVAKPDLTAPPAPQEHRPAKAKPGPGPKIEGLTVEEYAHIRAALWADEARRKEILKENGLTELKWKVIDRRWSKHIESLAEKPAELSTLLEVLQRATFEHEVPSVR